MEVGSVEHHALVVSKVREYLARGGRPSRDAFLAVRAGHGVGHKQIRAYGWARLLAAADVKPVEVDVSELDFDDDETAPGVVHVTNVTNYSAAPEAPPRAPEPRELLELQKLRAKHAEGERRLRDALEALAEADARAGVVGQLRAAPEPAPILRRETASGLREATAVVLASDLHLEEVVNPAAIEWRNAFNPTIARMRMERMAENILWKVEMYRPRFQLRDLVLWLGGDCITGRLHEENDETNAMAPPEAILFAYDLLAGLIKTLLDRGNFERVIVPASCGNHGRTTQYTRAKTRVENSYELILYTQLAQLFASDPRVSFHIAKGSHLYMQIYGETARFHHGDDVRYAGGSGGITIPINKALDAWENFRHADWTALGHWHQLTWQRNFVVNGSLIGYNEYALSIKARYEPAQQAFFLCDSKHGRTCFSPLRVVDAAEGWQREVAA